MEEGLVLLALEIGKISTRVKALEDNFSELSKRAENPMEKADEVSAVLTETIAALKEAMGKNLQLAEDYLSFDIDETGGLKQLEEKVQQDV